MLIMNAATISSTKLAPTINALISRPPTYAIVAATVSVAVLDITMARNRACKPVIPNIYSIV